jgi:hypothetical protein
MGGLLTALAVAFLTLYSSGKLAQWQEAGNKTRLYTELISKREEAETGLRKEMFRSIIDTFLKSGSEALDAEVLKLELLAYNFHESFNLVPLFKHLQRRIESEGENGRKGAASGRSLDSGETLQYLMRLRKAASDIIQKQLDSLELPGGFFDRQIEIRDPLDNPSLDGTIKVEGIERVIKLHVTTNDVRTHELRVSMNIETLNKAEEGIDSQFWVGPFEFPMIDNTRLSRDQRCAVIMKSYEVDPTNTFPVSVELTVVCFPGSRAALKEKPYYDDVLDKLTRQHPETNDPTRNGF